MVAITLNSTIHLFLNLLVPIISEFKTKTNLFALQSKQIVATWTTFSSKKSSHRQHPGHAGSHTLPVLRASHLTRHSKQKYEKMPQKIANQKKSL
ncbi:MAG: hypothetical protein ACI306_06215 [Muribaculaceae bacterium]